MDAPTPTDDGVGVGVIVVCCPKVKFAFAVDDVDPNPTAPERPSPPSGRGAGDIAVATEGVSAEKTLCLFGAVRVEGRTRGCGTLGVDGLWNANMDDPTSVAVTFGVIKLLKGPLDDSGCVNWVFRLRAGAGLTIVGAVVKELMVISYVGPAAIESETDVARFVDDGAAKGPRTAALAAANGLNDKGAADIEVIGEAVVVSGTTGPKTLDGILKVFAQTLVGRAGAENVKGEGALNPPNWKTR